MPSRLPRSVLALALAVVARQAVAAVSVLPGDGCPSSAAIAAHLERLGALELLSQLGTAEVKVEEPSLHVYFRDRRGESLGVRVVTATTDCAARAALAAAVIAAFAGDWAQTALVPPASVATAKTPSPQEPTSLARPPWRSEVGGMVLGIHDGDAGGFGLGVRADLGRGAWMASALFEGSSERTQPLGSGQGAYRFVRAGLGLGACMRWSRVFWDATLVPMVDRLSLRGKNLQTNETVTSWGLAFAGHTRLGWRGRRLRPFLFAGASYRVPGERMTLVDRPDKVPLSPVNAEAGLGISIAISP
ncbi:MAG: hypothetical protein JXP73_06570 [Deltaproteobacteria bacterium]|nr:hypothetical protein [Deltaproteobacteria bacterium]